MSRCRNAAARRRGGVRRAAVVVAALAGAALASPTAAEEMEFYNIPLLFNAYPGSGLNAQEARAALARVNAIYKPARIRFTLMEFITPSQNPGDGDASWTKTERRQVRRDGARELDGQVGNGRGVKVSAAAQPSTSHASLDGLAVIRNPVIVLREHPTGAEGTAQTMAHELGHALGLYDRNAASAKGQIMYNRGAARTGTALSPAEANDLKREARARGKVQKADCPAGGLMPPTTRAQKGSGGGASNDPAGGDYQQIEWATLNQNVAEGTLELLLLLDDIVPASGATAQFYVLFDLDDNLTVDLFLRILVTPPSFLTVDLLDESFIVIPDAIAGATLLNQEEQESDGQLLETDRPPVFLPDMDMIEVQIDDFGLPSGFPVVVSGSLGSPLDQFGLLYSDDAESEGAHAASSFGWIDPYAPPTIDVFGSQFGPDELVDLLLDDELLDTVQADGSGFFYTFVDLSLATQLEPAPFYFVTAQGQDDGDFGFFALPEPRLGVGLACGIGYLGVLSHLARRGSASASSPCATAAASREDPRRSPISS